MRETRVGMRELKNRLSKYLRRVKAGETIVITERGKPVGQIMPIQTDLASRLKKWPRRECLIGMGNRYRLTSQKR
jgi:prevent-host-death family protein